MGFYRNKPKSGPPRDAPLTQITTHLSQKVLEVLKKLSEERELPISKLIAYAVDNELACDPPFNYNIEIPDVPYKEFQYADEASKILKYLMKYFPGGTGLDMLVLCRRDMGIENPANLLLGYRELLKKQMVEVFRPINTKFRYPKDYMYIRATRETIEVQTGRRRKEIKQIIGLNEKGPLNDDED